MATVEADRLAGGWAADLSAGEERFPLALDAGMLEVSVAQEQASKHGHPTPPKPQSRFAQLVEVYTAEV